MALYKFTAPGGRGPFSGFQWPLPDGAQPGEWVTTKGPLVMCGNGVHYCTESQLIHWLDADLWEFEFLGQAIKEFDKCVAQSGRLLRRVETWNERTARLFAADCAESVLHLNPDPRCEEAIRVARAYANGDATRDELKDARDAANAAAEDAGVATWATRDAARAAMVAVGDDARIATENAARAAGSARAATGEAAMASTRATAWDDDWSAAWPAAWSDARNAGAAARAAIWGTMNANLLAYIRGEKS